MTLACLIKALCFIAWSILLMPSLAYLITHRKKRFKNVEAVLKDIDLQLYFDRFFPSEYIPENADLKKVFEKNYRRNYGIKHYIAPVLLLAVISGIGFYIIAGFLLYNLNIEKNEFYSIPPIAVSSFLGAFMWVANDQIQRWRVFNITSNDIYKCIFRFLIAVPIGYSFASILIDSVGIPVSFFLGTFPTDTLMTYGKRFVAQQLKIGEKGIEKKNELEQLQGINMKELERLQEEGVSNILQLAYSNPIDLTIRTNFDFNFVIDCMSQALLWLYVESNIDKLRLRGLRGAQEVCSILYNYEGKDSADAKMIAAACIDDTAKALNIPTNVLLQTLKQVEDDPYTEFICAIWCTA